MDSAAKGDDASFRRTVVRLCKERHAIVADAGGVDLANSISTFPPAVSLTTQDVQAMNEAIKERFANMVEPLPTSLEEQRQLADFLSRLQPGTLKHDGH